MMSRLMTPGVGPRGRKVVAGRHRGCSLVLLLLNLRDSVSVLIVSLVSRSSTFSDAARTPATSCTSPPIDDQTSSEMMFLFLVPGTNALTSSAATAPRNLVALDEPRVARATHHLVSSCSSLTSTTRDRRIIVIARRSIHQTIRISRSLTIAKI